MRFFDVENSLDYYSFGMLMPERNGGTNYRYSFQGQEADNEVKGKGNSVNYKYRMHDARLGRFFAVDPLTSKYPHYTPYSFSGNRVVDMIELEGLEPTFPKGFQETINMYKKMYSSPIYHKNESQTSFSNADAYTLFIYYNINYQAKLVNEENGDKVYGNQFTNSRLCAYDCITSAAIGVRILNDNYDIPINGGAGGNMRVYLSNIAKKGYAGEEFELNFNRKNGEIASMKGSFSKDITALTEGKKGNYFFGVAINEGVHSVVVGVHISEDGKTTYSFMDNNDYSRKVSSEELDEIITNWAYSLSGNTRKTYYRQLINTKISSGNESGNKSEDNKKGS